MYHNKHISATMFGGHIRLVFTLVLFIFLGCVGVTLTSFRFCNFPLLVTTIYTQKNKSQLDYPHPLPNREIPLEVLTMPDSKRKSLGGEQQYDKVLNHNL